MVITSLEQLDLENKRVLIREDFNVPLQKGVIISDARIRAALPTIQYALERKAAVILLSHLGRPQEGKVTAEFSLAPVASRLECLLQEPVRFVRDWLAGFDIVPGEIVLCENVRFERGERENDPRLGKKIAQLGDVFIMDAFATAHRSEASTVGAARFSSCAGAGFLLIAELDALNKALESPSRPILAVVGGSKVSSKLLLLSALVRKVDYLILGGGLANTFLAAQGYPIGKSLYEASLMNEAKQLLELAQRLRVRLLLPIDVCVATEFSMLAQTYIKDLDSVQDHERIVDIGPKTIDCYRVCVREAASILWNGPMGAFEFSSFEQGTRALSQAIAETSAFSVAGGGDTLAAIEKYAVQDKISYISTGGGAFLQFIEGKNFPVLSVLQKGKRAYD